MHKLRGNLNQMGSRVPRAYLFIIKMGRWYILHFLLFNRIKKNCRYFLQKVCYIQYIPILMHKYCSRNRQRHQWYWQMDHFPSYSCKNLRAAQKNATLDGKDWHAWEKMASICQWMRCNRVLKFYYEWNVKSPRFATFFL